MTAGRPSLRLRLAALGLVGVLVALGVLLVVSFVSTEETSTSRSGSGELVERTRALSPWVPLTAAALAIPAAAAAWWWAGRAVAPLERIAAVADEIQATSLDRRIDLVDAPVEVQTLADSFDRMLDRLAAASEVQARLVEDTSHQLRTPIAVLATGIDVAVADPAAGPTELRDALRQAREGTTRLEHIVDGLLADARAARHSAARTGNDLVAVVAAEIAAATAAGVEVRLRAPDRLLAACDGGAVGRAVASLLENAVAHAPAGSIVDVEVGLDDVDGLARIAVTDAGPGIPAGRLDQIFDRYWSDRDEGLGIGLSIVKQVAEAHEGVDVISPVADGVGTRVLSASAPTPDTTSFLWQQIIDLVINCHRFGNAGSMRRVGILVGPGVLSDLAGLHALADRIGSAVINTWGAKGVFRWDSPFHGGTAGLQARDFELAGLGDVDLLLTSGLDDGEVTSRPWEGRAPVVDLAPGSLAAYAESWPEPTQEPERPRLYTELSAVVMPMYDDPATPPARLRAIAAASPPGALVVAPPGLVGYWVARTWSTIEPGSVVVPSSPDPAVAERIAVDAAASGRAVTYVTDTPIDVPGVDVVVWTDDLTIPRALIDVAGPLVAWT